MRAGPQPCPRGRRRYQSSSAGEQRRCNGSMRDGLARSPNAPSPTLGPFVSANPLLHTTAPKITGQCRRAVAIALNLQDRRHGGCRSVMGLKRQMS